jgi:protocatechuate 3,4-dioxygenase beta subunit
MRGERSMRRIGRREALGAIGTLGAALALGGRGAQARAALKCIAVPELTEGPFFVDEKLNRSDLTTGTNDPFVVNGIPLALDLSVYEMSGDSCTPLRGAQVDIWHANAEGFYSDEPSARIQRKRTIGEKYLRGYQLTDGAGAVRFTTIYPGWYVGRTIHIHFKVRTVPLPNTERYEFTSQLFMEDSLNDVVVAQPPYNTRGERRIRNSNDGIYRRAGSQLLLDVKPATRGYVGTFAIGLRTS